jgi:hypothetical protein
MPEDIPEELEFSPETNPPETPRKLGKNQRLALFLIILSGQKVSDTTAGVYYCFLAGFIFLLPRLCRSTRQTVRNYLRNKAAACD